MMNIPVLQNNEKMDDGDSEHGFSEESSHTGPAHSISSDEYPQMHPYHYDPIKDGPIERGESTNLPRPLEPGQEGYNDNFRLDSDVLSEQHIKYVVLPKFIKNPDTGNRERSYLVVGFDASKNPAVYKEVLTACRQRYIRFNLHVVDQEENTEIIWKFDKARIHAADFGYVGKNRPEPAEITVEIDYQVFEVEGQTM